MIKHGEVTENSLSDFAPKKAVYYDEDGNDIADEEHKTSLKKPKLIRRVPDYEGG